MLNCVSKNSNVFLIDSERQPCEIYTRVMGYIRPVSEFNRGKQGEYAERECFQEPATGCCKTSGHERRNKQLDSCEQKHREAI